MASETGSYRGSDGTPGDGALPPPAEELHLPDPSYLPVWVAFGTMIALVGVVLNWVLFGIGMVILLIPLALWIREAREEFRGLPREHHQA